MKSCGKIEVGETSSLIPMALRWVFRTLSARFRVDAHQYFQTERSYSVPAFSDGIAGCL